MPANYKFRKRIPKLLQEVINRKELKLTLANEADAVIINLAIDKALSIMNNKKLNVNVKDELIKAELKDYIKVSSLATELLVVDSFRWSDAVKHYLDSSANVTSLEYKNRVYFYTELMPNVFKHVCKTDNPVISDITSQMLYNASKVISNLPSRNYRKYRSLGLYELIKGIENNTIKVSGSELLSVDTVNKLVKRIRALSTYGISTGLFNLIPTISTHKKASKGVRNEREALSHEEINQLIEASDNINTTCIIQMARFTGMRTSELSKLQIKEIDGVMCFDLTSSKERLKTSSSYRKIPVHSELRPYLKQFEIIKENYSISHIGRVVKSLIDSVLEDTDKKSLYSLRHSFATELIQKGADSNMVSELMGHTHSSMTLSRYAKGFSIHQLQETIELL